MSETCSRCGAILNTSRQYVQQHGASCGQCNLVWAILVAEDLEAGEAGVFEEAKWAVVKLTSAANIVYPAEQLKAGDFVRLHPDHRATKVDLDP